MNIAWVNEAKDLRRQVRGTDRDVKAALQNLRREHPAVVTEIEAHEQALETDLRRDQQAMWEQLHRLQSQSRQLRELSGASETGPGYMKKLNMLVTSLEAALGSFRDRQRRQFDALRRDEAELTQELAAAETDIHSWADESTAEFERRLRALSVLSPPVAVTDASGGGSGAGRPSSAARIRSLSQPRSRPSTARSVTPSGARPSHGHGSGAVTHRTVLSEEDERAMERGVEEARRIEAERAKKHAQLELYRLQRQTEELKQRQVVAAAAGNPVHAKKRAVLGGASSLFLRLGVVGSGDVCTSLQPLPC